MENTRIFEMADRLKALQEQKKDLEAQVKALGAEITELDEQLSDAMTEAELDRFSRNGSTFYLKSRLFASPVAGLKDDMMQALKANGYGSLVTETVNANTLASFIKEQREITGEDIPAWLGDTVSTYEKVSVGIRKS
jgi:phage host-nuclease inhibitor protein Gam